MSINIELFELCEKLRKEISRAEEIVASASRPILMDQSLLPTIHKLLEPLMAQDDKNYATRAEVFVMLYLYAPERILNKYHKGSQCAGIFVKIAQVTNKHKATITKLCSSLGFYYKTYSDFRKLVDKYLTTIYDALFEMKDSV